MGNQQLKGFRGHSSVVIGNNVFVWGGWRNRVPLEHESAKKTRLLSSVSKYDLLTAALADNPTKGKPPFATIDYSSCSIDDCIYYFGGRCMPDDCFHNDFFELNTKRMEWRQILCIGGGPMKKAACRMISFKSDDGDDCVLVIGGRGPVPKDVPNQSQYNYQQRQGKDHDSPRLYTNEVHIMNVSKSPGNWMVPNIRRYDDEHRNHFFPPTAFFSLNSLPENKAIIFGGMCVDDHGEPYHTDHAFEMTFSKDEIEFKHLTQKGNFDWPRSRDSHSSAVISRVTGDHGIMKYYLLVLGGVCLDPKKNLLLTSDFWIMDIEEKSWKKIELMERITRRFDHSMTSFMMSKNCFWVLISGGRINRSDLVTGPYTIVILELVYSLVNHEWQVNNVINTDDLKSTFPCPKSLLQCLSEGRIANEQHFAQVNKELMKLKRELHDQYDQLRKLTDDQNDQVQFLQRQIKKGRLDHEATIRQHERAIQEHEDTIQKKNWIIQERDVIIQGKENDIAEIQNQVQSCNEIIQNQLQSYSWIVQKEEVKLTDDNIGKGSYGHVQIAIFRGTKVAAKCMHSVIVSVHTNYIFTREMEISSKIHHPNIVQFIGATVTDAKTPILLYELMAFSLYKRLGHEKPLENSQILSISLDILSALCYLHEMRPNPILHRDVSSPNVLMEPVGNNRYRSKLSDFGSANLQAHVSTVIPGNQSYAAPEATNPKDHSPSMDVYSFGVLLTEMVLHRTPEIDQRKRKNSTDSIKWEAIKKIVLDCIIDDHKKRITSLKLLEEVQKLQDY